MTAASNSEARKRAAGIAASNPTDPEPTGTLEGAPGADSEALAASQRVETDALIDFITAHTAGHLAPEFCTAVCLARAVLASSWLAERAGRDGVRTLGHKVIRLAQANAVLARANPGGSERLWLDLIHVLEADLARFDDNHSEEARRG